MCSCNNYIITIKGSAEWRRCQAVVDEFFTKGLAWSTQRSYQSGIRRYEHFCSRLGRHSLPDSEDTLSAFAVTLAKEGVRYTSLKVYLLAIRHHQIESGQGDPGIPRMARLEYILKGIRREGACSAAHLRKERQPITPALLKRLFKVWRAGLISEIRRCSGLRLVWHSLPSYMLESSLLLRFASLTINSISLCQMSQ